MLKGCRPRMDNQHLLLQQAEEAEQQQQLGGLGYSKRQLQSRFATGDGGGKERVRIQGLEGL